MVDKPDNYRDVINRRRFIELAGVSGAAALAGCGDGDTTTEDDGSGGTMTEAGDQIYDERHVGMTNQSPSDVQFNPHNPSGYSQIALDLIFDKFARYNFGNNEWIPEAIESWEHTGDTFELTLREGMTWSNGESITAEDVALFLRIGKKMGNAYADYTGEITTEGDLTTVMQLSGDVSPDIVEIDVLANGWVQTPPSVFQEYLDNFDSMEEDEALRQLQDFAWNEPIASGPFAFDKASGSQLDTTRRADHEYADNINFEKYAFQFIDGNQAVHQAVKELDIDSVFTTFTPPRIVAQYPDAVEMVTTPSLWGYGLYPNHSDEEVTSDRAVRQAIAFAIDRETVVQNAGPLSKSAPDWEVGIANDTQESALGDRAGDFETYGKAEKLTDRATQVLDEAGYSKDGDTWKDGNGSAIRLPLLVPSGWTDWITAAETVVDHLTEFGFKAEVDSRGFGTLQETIWPNSNFVLSSGGWNAGPPQGALPYFSLRHMLIQNFRGINYNYPAADSSRGGSSADVSVPDIGDFGGDDAMTVNPSERLTELSQTNDDATADEIVKEQAWVTNVDLPMIPIAEKQEQSFLTEDDWDIPENVSEDPNAKVRWPPVHLPRRGKMNYKGN